MKSVLEIIKGFVQLLFPLLENIGARKKCEKKKECLLEARNGEIPSSVSASFPSWSEVTSRDDLKELYEQSLTHKASIEEKAKPLVAIAGFSTTLFVGLSGMTMQLFELIPVFWLKFFVALMGIYAVFNMTLAALSAITVITNILEMYLLVPPVDDEAYEYKKFAMLNELTNIIRTNYLASSFECLKRSLIALFLLFSITVVVA